MNLNVENYFISTFSSQKSRIGDDGAVAGEWIYSKDLFFENVHFKRHWLSPFQIGYKAMMVNISDAIAMNAIPRYALLGIGMPKSFSLNEMNELSSGIRTAASEYGMEIIGGDTIGNTKLDLSITIISYATDPLLRKGLKQGDLIAYTGEIGKSLRGLRYLMAGGKVHSKSRFVAPKLRQSFVSQARRYLRCGLDISDGLCSDVEKLTRANRLGMQWDKKIPKRVRCSGEEYEMLIAFSPAKRNAIRRIAGRTRTPLTIVAHAVRGKYTNRCKSHHF
ncbi:thiamine-phosphate kinase [Sulfuricurvum sp.]|uniref:thiamine-phosphate kinase n=1 Tax=Sulfuricurvum sp. TaxID=2025608 RepID=UPI002E312BE0|nr:thiamine-phosphate kinase [Sulfuricurvum sp.]HEX5329137.1 thiamine-phosphate kinase [Sulfuricurvum sp.]